VKQYAMGDRVMQSTYGTGTVTSVNEYHTVVDFDEHGSRTFVTRMVSLEASDTIAPVRAKRTRRKSAAQVARS
jgi:hypothetical protein